MFVATSKTVYSLDGAHHVSALFDGESIAHLVSDESACLIALTTLMGTDESAYLYRLVGTTS
jgi:hypothetical protein